MSYTQADRRTVCSETWLTTKCYLMTFMNCVKSLASKLRKYLQYAIYLPTIKMTSLNAQFYSLLTSVFLWLLYEGVMKACFQSYLTQLNSLFATKIGIMFKQATLSRSLNTQKWLLWQNMAMRVHAPIRQGTVMIMKFLGEM